MNHENRQATVLRAGSFGFERLWFVGLVAWSVAFGYGCAIRSSSRTAPSELGAAVLISGGTVVPHPNLPAVPTEAANANSLNPTFTANAALVAPVTNAPLHVSLAWDASPGAASYRVHWGVATNQFTNSISASGTSVTISNLVRRTRYYFAATAVDSAGYESDFSNFATYPVPVTNYVGVEVLTNGVPFLQLLYTNPPEDVVIFTTRIWQTNNDVSVVRLDAGKLLIGNTNQP